MKVVLDDGAYLPEYAHEDDGGLDFRSPVDAIVPARGSYVFDTGVHLEIPKGYVGLLTSKSGLNIIHSVLSDGLIDCGFTGSITVKLYNEGYEDYHVNRGDKISQMVILPYYKASLELTDKLDDTPRGEGRFGSTGR